MVDKIDKNTPIPAKVQEAMQRGLRQRYALGTVDLPKEKGKS